MNRIKDKTGLRVGIYTVLSFAGYIKPGNKAYTSWNCLCDCGKEFQLASGDINPSKTKSCGCLKTRRKYDPKFSASFNKRYDNIVNNARYRNIPCKITREEFLYLSGKPCFYCGLDDASIRGLDRFDNTQGYTLENVVPCCKRCNIAKNNMTVEEFMDLINSIYNYRVIGA